MKQLYAVIGAGGFGREVMPIARAMLASNPDAEAVFVIEDQYTRPADVINGQRVLSMSEFLGAREQKFFNIAIGDSRTRQRIAQQMPAEVQPFSIQPANMLSYDRNEIGPGAIFCGFTHVTSNARIGRFFHCNIYSYVAHDCVIGDYVTFAPGVMCNGHVVVEEHAYIGTGVVIRDGTEKPIVIGAGAIVGAGAVVTKSVAPGATVVGNPARALERR